MLGLILMYVGMVLISNGIYTISGINDKSQAVMNLFTGGLGPVLNIIDVPEGLTFGISLPKGKQGAIMRLLGGMPSREKLVGSLR